MSCTLSNNSFKLGLRLSIAATDFVFKYTITFFPVRPGMLAPADAACGGIGRCLKSRLEEIDMGDHEGY